MAALFALAGGTLRAAPIYLLRYAFTNQSGFGPRAVAGINDAGDVCGTFGDANATNTFYSAYLMRSNGVVEDLFPYSVTNTVQWARANGISQRHADGSVQVVGTVQQADGFQRGIVWTVAADGTFSVDILSNLVLPTNSLAPGEQSYGEANAINSSGLVVGDGSSYLVTVGLYWAPPYSAAPFEWHWYDDTEGVAVNDQGDALVVGQLHSESYLSTALVDGSTVMTELPAGSTNDLDVIGYAMSGDYVAGQAWFGTNTYGSPFAWHNGDPALTALPAPGGMATFDCEADSVNASGDAVGYVNGGSLSGEFQMLWKNSGGTYQPYILDSLFVAQPDLSNEDLGLGTYQAYDMGINDRGDIALHTDYRFYSGSDAVQVYRPVTNGVVQWLNTNQYSLANSYYAFAGYRSDGAITAAVELVRADGYAGPVSVHYTTVDGEAVADRDYLAQSGTLTWNTNESGFKNITVQLATNSFTYVPTYETFYLNLTNVTGAEFGVTNVAMEIYDYDSEALDFADTLYGYGEYDVQAGTTNVVLTLTRDDSLDGTMVITNVMTEDSSATAGVDYLGITNTIPVTWGPGQAGSVSYSIPLMDTTNLAAPVYFNVQAEGTIDATNDVSAWATVEILPPGQTPPFQFDTPVPLTQSNLFDLVSYVEQGVTVLLQSSSNLVDWQTVTEVQCTNGMVQFNPTVLTGPKAQFYRAVVH